MYVSTMCVCKRMCAGVCVGLCCVCVCARARARVHMCRYVRLCHAPSSMYSSCSRCGARSCVFSCVCLSCNLNMYSGPCAYVRIYSISSHCSSLGHSLHLVHCAQSILCVQVLMYVRTYMCLSCGHMYIL